MRQAGEPSVEEILESIKKVIARDNRDSAAEVRRTREQRGIVQPEPADAEEADEVLDLSEADEFAELESDYPGEHEPDPVVLSDAIDTPLLGEETRSSMRDSLTALAMLAEPGAAPQIVRSGETSLEGMARELLRPALSEWLDKNLPPLVERLVAAEIARIVGKKG
jgi:cell pole-organizing protein PopZ